MLNILHESDGPPLHIGVSNSRLVKMDVSHFELLFFICENGIDFRVRCVVEYFDDYLQETWPITTTTAGFTSSTDTSNSSSTKGFRLGKLSIT